MSNCTKCGSSGAYVGFSAVECPNPACEHYKKPELAPELILASPPCQHRAASATGKKWVLQAPRGAGKTETIRKTIAAGRKIREMIALGRDPNELTYGEVAELMSFFRSYSKAVGKPVVTATQEPDRELPPEFVDVRHMTVAQHGRIARALLDAVCLTPSVTEPPAYLTNESIVSRSTYAKFGDHLKRLNATGGKP